MCLAIPAQVRTINENNLAVVDILGVTREVALDLTPSAQVGDFVLVHAGFAIEVVSEEDAQETLDLIKQIPELADVEGIIGGRFQWTCLLSKIQSLLAA